MMSVVNLISAVTDSSNELGWALPLGWLCAMIRVCALFDSLIVIGQLFNRP